MQLIKNLGDFTILEVSPDTPAVRDIVELSIFLGNVNILCKGYADIITNGQKVYLVKNEGSLKRCGGIGDILAGLSCLYSVWSKNNEDLLIGCVLASYLCRQASKKAFE